MQEIIALAKNMRGILYLKDKNEGFIKFVLRYNRRRSIGIPSFMEPPEGKCFLSLDAPRGAKRFYSKLNEKEKTIFLSMLYIAPILTTPSYLKDFEEYEIIPIMSKEDLDVREGLRHLRIAEYSMLDYRLSDKEEMDKYISKDLRRFWRIKGDKVKVGSYCSIDLPGKLRDIARGYSIVIGIKID